MTREIENIALQTNFTPRERRYFDKLKAELLALFDGRDYETIKVDEDTRKLKQISDKLAEMEEFVKTKNIPELSWLVDPTLLQFEDEVTVPSLDEAFRVADKFVKDKSDQARVKISYLGANFKEWFNKMNIEPFPASKLLSYTLERSAYDSELFLVQGGVGGVATDLAAVWKLIEAQKTGEPGPLLNDGRHNIFFVHDQMAILRAIHVNWFENGWSVCALELGTEECRRNGRVFVPAPY